MTQNAAGEATVILTDYDPTVGIQLHLQGATYRKAVPVKARVLNIFAAGRAAMRTKPSATVCSKSPKPKRNCAGR